MKPFVLNIPSTRPHRVFPEPIAKYGTDKRHEQDIRMMQSPEFWPHSVLPLKRMRRSTGEYGSAPGGTAHVFAHMESAVWNGTALYVDANVFSFDASDPSTYKARVEVSAELAVQEGWTVD